MPCDGAGGRPLVVIQDVVVRAPGGAVVLGGSEGGRGVSLSIGRERVGVVGVNGVGKTTLARVLVGEVRAERGSVLWDGVGGREGGRIGYLPQRVEELWGERVVAEVFGRSGAEGLEGGDVAALARLGVGWVEPLMSMSRLSGGERIKVALAALLARDPELLVLDEPTNNLDVAAREALYGLVAAWRGGMVVISHDRRLLGLMDAIVELTPPGITRYGGNYDVYVELKGLEAAAAERGVAHAAKELRRAEREAREAAERQGRREARGRSARAKGGVPKIVLEKMRETSQRSSAKLRGVHGARVEGAASELHDAKGRVERKRKLAFGAGGFGVAGMGEGGEVPEGKVVLAVEDLWFSHPAEAGGRELFAGLSLRVTGPRRVALVGPNGSGKSTLLRLIAGGLRPSSGSVRVGVDRVALLDQHAALLDGARSVLENFMGLNPEIGEAGARLALARFLFRGDEAQRRAGELSGGERLRAALACVLGGARPPRLLMLDEPGNHLDLESLEELEGALRGYGGALIVVSHDGAFLEAVGVEERIALGGPRGRVA